MGYEPVKQKVKCPRCEALLAARNLPLHLDKHRRIDQGAKPKRPIRVWPGGRLANS